MMTFNWVVLMHRLPSKGARSILVANIHFLEIMAPLSSISMKKSNWRFEPWDGAASDYQLKSWRNFIFTFRTDPKSIDVSCRYFTNIKIFFHENFKLSTAPRCGQMWWPELTFLSINLHVRLPLQIASFIKRGGLELSFLTPFDK